MGCQQGPTSASPSLPGFLGLLQSVSRERAVLAIPSGDTLRTRWEDAAHGIVALCHIQGTGSFVTFLFCRRTHSGVFFLALLSFNCSPLLNAHCTLELRAFFCQRNPVQQQTPREQFSLQVSEYIESRKAEGVNLNEGKEN